MQVVSRGTIDQAVEYFEKLRRDGSIVPCGTIAGFGTGFVGQPTKEAKGLQIQFRGSKRSRSKLGDSFHVEHKHPAFDST